LLAALDVFLKGGGYGFFLGPVFADEAGFFDELVVN
jgi:hypothetical protein